MPCRISRICISIRFRTPSGSATFWICSPRIAFADVRGFRVNFLNALSTWGISPCCLALVICVIRCCNILSASCFCISCAMLLWCNIIIYLFGPCICIGEVPLPIEGGVVIVKGICVSHHFHVLASNFARGVFASPHDKSGKLVICLLKFLVIDCLCMGFCCCLLLAVVVSNQYGEELTANFDPEVIYRRIS